MSRLLDMLRWNSVALAVELTVLLLPMEMAGGPNPSPLSQSQAAVEPAKDPLDSVRAYEKGKAEARRDLAAGRVIIKFMGLPSPEFYSYTKLMSERCGVLIQPIAGCLVSEELDRYRNGYNEVSTAWIGQKHGTNIFQEVWEVAQADYLKEIEKQFREAPKTPTEKGGKNTYRVQPGDTFGKIAKQQGIPLKVLLNANPGVDPRKLQINQRIQLPAQATH